MSSSHRDRSSKARNSEELAGRLIDLTGRLQRRLRVSYHKTKLSPARLSALAFIVSKGECIGGQIAQAEQVTAPTMTRILDGLEQSGFITRTASIHDRRMIEVRATAEGRVAYEEARAWQIRRLAEDISRLEERERARVAGAVDILDGLAEQDSR